MPGDDGIDWSQWPEGREGFQRAFGSNTMEAIEQIRSGKPGLIDWSQWPGGEQGFRATFGDKAQAMIKSWFAGPQSGTLAAQQRGEAVGDGLGANQAAPRVGGARQVRDQQAGATMVASPAQGASAAQGAASTAASSQGATAPRESLPRRAAAAVLGKFG